MKTLQTTDQTSKTLTIHTTLFDLLAAMQEEASGPEVDMQTTDTKIVSTVAEWMQSHRIIWHRINPMQSAA